MGVVYKARDTKLGRLVALKFLAPHLTADEGLKKRFMQEARAASSLDHSNIGTIHEINETEDNQLFIAMAYYEGQTLRSALSDGPMPIPVAINYATQIAKGLSSAQCATIIHRDIKPANVIITSDDTVKIVDFGLAKMAGKASSQKLDRQSGRWPTSARSTCRERKSMGGQTSGRSASFSTRCLPANGHERVTTIMQSCTA